MSRRRLDDESPDRLYTVTGGRGDASDIELDLVTLVIAEFEPAAGMQSEHTRILELSRGPIAIVELSAELHLPVSVVKILVSDLLDTGRLSLRRPSPPRGKAQLPDMETLKQVLIGLESL
ncbi:DUF742 domain-containing protein [Actinocorallia populi]|uniref:DUF742 domain-containing protein n=1 Tax=Actinocorallia populi TaxID=2079200 RepID=UPI000D0942CA|nr:DUF742 domain-containing protein [Actinocorallia populi]